jgi:ribose transport system ATP-binding protein
MAMIQKLAIKTPDEKTPVANLSGGNQQKVALAKWVHCENRVLIIDEPTRGVDIGAKVEIYNIINELASSGIAIIIVSSETSELMGICDRIMVIRKGEVRGMIGKEDFSEEEILRLAIGA